MKTAHERMWTLKWNVFLHPHHLSIQSYFKMAEYTLSSSARNTDMRKISVQRHCTYIFMHNLPQMLTYKWSWPLFSTQTADYWILNTNFISLVRAVSRKLIEICKFYLKILSGWCTFNKGQMKIHSHLHDLVSLVHASCCVLLCIIIMAVNTTNFK